MRKLFITAGIMLLAAATSYGQSVTLTVYYKFINVEPGYDHETKTEIFIDGSFYGVSEKAIQTKGGSVSVEVEPGEHDLLVMNYALYDGIWEKHIIDNNYSIDASYENTVNISKKKNKLYLVFDLDNETYSSWKKPVKIK